MRGVTHVSQRARAIVREHSLYRVDFRLEDFMGVLRWPYCFARLPRDLLQQGPVLCS
jgi:hypothetical protein